MQRHDRAQILSSQTSRKLKKIKTVPWGKEQLSEVRKHKSLTDIAPPGTKVQWSAGGNTSSEDDRHSPSIVSYLFTFPMLSQDLSVIKLLISLVFKWFSKEINLTQYSFLYWNGLRTAESSLNQKLPKLFLTTAKQGGGSYMTVWKGDFSLGFLCLCFQDHSGCLPGKKK